MCQVRILQVWIMKTGCFNDLRKYHSKGIISIAIGDSKSFVVPCKMKELSPSWKLLKGYKSGVINESQYVKEFMLKLELLNPYKTVQALGRLAKGLEPILICHCQKSEFCHRHLVAEWLEQTGIIIEELGMGITPRNKGRIGTKREKIRLQLALLCEDNYNPRQKESPK